ncbi:hypothetical protein C5S31_12655 [ANME-1 cluster archaeon GoMg2]|nr:hypothetical protein [ANME-1 cluster archaeon GoMg2]
MPKKAVTSDWWLLKIGGETKRKMKTKMIGTLAIAGLIAMAVFVGTAAADGGANIFASNSGSYNQYTTNFLTTENVFAWGYLGPESAPNTTLCGSAGCGGRIYVVNHSDTWTNGTLLDDRSGGYEIVTWGAAGYFNGKLAWPKDLTPGEYDLILDLNCTGYNGEWTNISDPRPAKTGYLTDPIWPFTVKGDEPEPIPEFSTMAIPVVSILGLLFLFNYRKHRRH